MNNEPIEIQQARENDLKNELNENAQIDKLMGKLKKMKGKPLSQIRDEAHQAIAEKNIYSYARRSAKTLFTMMQTISNVKRGSSTDTKLQAIMENQKILASLVIQLKLNTRQINEMAQK
jgi:hypothetical protein